MVMAHTPGSGFAARDGFGAAVGRAAPRRSLLRDLLRSRRSPIARRIVGFNLLGLAVLMVGVLWLNPLRDRLGEQRADALARQAGLLAQVIEARLETVPPSAGHITGAAAVDLRRAAATLLSSLELAPGETVALFDAAGRQIAYRAGSAAADGEGPIARLDAIGTRLWERLGFGATTAGADPLAAGADPLAAALSGNAGASVAVGPAFAAAAPVRVGDDIIGAVMTTGAGAVDRLAWQGQERLLQLFVIALLVSGGLSLLLAATLADPLARLAEAASGHERDGVRAQPDRVQIPDLPGSPDEIGRLSDALRGMVSALYDRIDANEQFAADVAHEIKNPLASLRSAVGTLRLVRKDEQRERLLEVIEQDVQRLDRLVSDISNASRLDSELVKEEEQPFDLLRMLSRLLEHLAAEAREKGIDFVCDLPEGAIIISGLEGRLAQVFVNLVTNAISFCEAGDAIRVWARERDNRVLVVVEDTGPGIPEAALSKVFQRFYSDRPAHHFGKNSGLGLAISKQIVEAHGGVIWAENIRAAGGEPGSPPLGARFIVGLPT